MFFLVYCNYTFKKKYSRSILYLYTSLYFTTYFDEYTSVILLLKSMIEVYFSCTTVTRSITEVYLTVYLKYTYPMLILITVWLILRRSILNTQNIIAECYPKLLEVLGTHTF